MEKKHTHRSLILSLASHLRATRDRLVWEDMQLGPAGSPRPDVFTPPKTYSRLAPISYEVKVSAADFRRDITAGKWMSYLEFSAGVVFAAPAGLIAKSDVPPGCGLIVLGDNGWRMVKGPTLKHMTNLPSQVWQKLIIDGIQRQITMESVNPRNHSDWTIVEIARKKSGDTLANALSDHMGAVKRLLRERTEHLELADAIAEEKRLARENLRDQMAADEVGISAARSEMCELLGLPSDASIRLIRRTVMLNVRRISEDHEVIRLRKALRDIQASLSKGLDPLPYCDSSNQSSINPEISSLTSGVMK